jgi:hypothetical protein
MENRPLRRSIRRCETDLKMCLNELARQVVDSDHLARNHDTRRGYMNTVMRFRGP